VKPAITVLRPMSGDAVWRRLGLVLVAVAFVLQGLILFTGPGSGSNSVQSVVRELSALAGPSFSGPVLCMDVTAGDATHDGPEHHHHVDGCPLCAALGHTCMVHPALDAGAIAFFTVVDALIIQQGPHHGGAAVRLADRPRGPPVLA